MFTVFAYGSLMHPDDIEETFGSDVVCETCLLSGFKRHYGQRSEWRTNDDGEKAGVLTVSPSHSKNGKNKSYCNGVLIRNIEDNVYKKYQERETGYELVGIPSSSFDLCENSKEKTTEYVTVPIGAWRMNEWNPLESYMKHCEEGARHWGTKFYQLFCRTTYQTGFSEVLPHPMN